MMKKIFLGLLAVIAAAPAAAAQPAGEREVSIPFVNHRAIQDFRPIDNDTLLLRARGRWYRAELMGPCVGLRFARAIGVHTRGAGRFDRFSSVIVEGERCAVESLVESAPPERRARRR